MFGQSVAQTVSKWVSRVLQQLGIAPAILLVARILPLPEHGKILGLPSICPFHMLTGKPCPGCGMTRSLVCMAHGQLHESFCYHPLGPVVFLLLVCATINSALRLVRPSLVVTIPAKYSKPAAWAATAVLMMAWAVRLAGAIPSPP
jgi:hypothetical protein